MGYKEYTVFIDMNKQRLQELAGITELGINKPYKIFSWSSKDKDEGELCYDKEDIITYYYAEDENISFSSELYDIGYDEGDILEQNESLEQSMTYLEDNGYEDASIIIYQYINFKNDLVKFNIPYKISYFGDGGTVYINLDLKYNDIQNYIK